MRTTITLDDDVAKLLSQARQMKRTSLKDVVNQALRQGLLSMATPDVRRRPFETKSVALGECLIGNVDDVAEALAVAEDEAFR
jgi:hypothetical protein